MPRAWESFKIHYRYRETFYHILVKNGKVGDAITKRVTVDGVMRPDGVIPLVDDRREHQVEVLVTKQ
jgi:cyclic beta-1,2-glucan synthetase